MNRFNINSNVKIKLTEFGIDVLKREHEEMRYDCKYTMGYDIGEFNLKLDEEGYYTIQAWEMMETFGGYLNQLNENNPFEIEILIDENDLK